MNGVDIQTGEYGWSGNPYLGNFEEICLGKRPDEVERAVAFMLGDSNNRLEYNRDMELEMSTVKYKNLTIWLNYDIDRTGEGNLAPDTLDAICISFPKETNCQELVLEYTAKFGNPLRFMIDIDVERRHECFLWRNESVFCFMEIDTSNTPYMFPYGMRLINGYVDRGDYEGPWWGFVADRYKNFVYWSTRNSAKE